MSIVRYTSVESVLAKIMRDYPGEVNEADVIEMIAEVLETVQAKLDYDEAVAFVEVKNYKCEAPAGMLNVVQIARNICYESDPLTTCPATTTAALTVEETGYTPVALDCDGSPINGYDIAYYRPYYDLIYEYEGWSRSGLYYNCYNPVRLSNNTFFSSVVCTETREDLKQLYINTRDEYTFQDPYFVFNFKEGFVAISYLRSKLDDRGYPMIPDNRETRDAILNYVRFKNATKKYDMNPESPQLRMYKAETENDWQWYCQQAKNRNRLPASLDDHQDILEQRSYLLPRQHRYYGFFGRLNTQEGRNWNRPNNFYRGLNEFNR